jgi:hypothetical protein
MMGPCFKQTVTATIVTQSGERFVATNHCETPQSYCPRDAVGFKSGQGYHLCKTECRQPAHAEVNALAAAGDKALGADIYVEGHTYVCSGCSDACDAAGIKSITIGPPPSIKYPTGNPKDLIGSRKPPLMSVVPAPALWHLGQAMANGASKYGAMNFRDAGVRASIYIDAANRHMSAWFDSKQENAEDSGVHHLAHAMACMAILLDCTETGMLIDDRPTVAGPTVEMLGRFTQ